MLTDLVFWWTGWLVWAIVGALLLVFIIVGLARVYYLTVEWAFASRLFGISRGDIARLKSVVGRRDISPEDWDVFYRIFSQMRSNASYLKDLEQLRITYEFECGHEVVFTEHKRASPLVAKIVGKWTDVDSAGHWYDITLSDDGRRIYNVHGSRLQRVQREQDDE